MTIFSSAHGRAMGKSRDGQLAVQHFFFVERHRYHPGEGGDRLRRVINSVHAAGKQIRFWDVPDDGKGWQELMLLGVDFIGTDRVVKLHAFLNLKVVSR